MTVKGLHRTCIEVIKKKKKKKKKKRKKKKKKKKHEQQQEEEEGWDSLCLSRVDELFSS